jgi:hypothetical protein
MRDGVVRDVTTQEPLAASSVGPASSPKKHPRGYQMSGVYGVKRALKRRGLRVLDGRTVLARSVAKWSAETRADLGGDLSSQQETVLGMAASAVVLLSMIDAWIGAHPELLIHTRRRTLAPLLVERTSIATHLLGLLKALGLARKAKPIESLSQIMARASAPKDPA